jgi:peptidoglycan-N-acetylglucosamine deacetylase
MRTDGVVASARWATPPGTSALGDALTAHVADVLRGYAAERGTEWKPGVDLVAGGVGVPCEDGSTFSASPTRLAVDCAVVVASGDIVGERLVVVRSEPGSPSDVDREVWYSDAASGAVHRGAALYADGTESRVLALVAEALRAGGRVAVGADPFAGLASETARPLLADSAAGGAGAVVTLVVPGAERTRPDSVHVPWRLLEPFLSDVGRAVRSAAESGEPYAPPTVPAADDPVDCALAACASLTFDDGPSSLTPALLDVLDRERVGATFYVQGVSVARNPGAALRAVSSGHEVGNHTWAHPNLTELEDDEVRDEVRRTQAAIAGATGVRASSLRPPYGASDRRVRDLVALPFVVWDVDTRDWQDPGVDVVVERAVSGATRGSVILMHDTHEDTIAAVPRIIDGLRARGFALVPVVDQFGGSLPGAGALVSHGPR